MREGGKGRGGEGRGGMDRREAGRQAGRKGVEGWREEVGEAGEGDRAYGRKR